MAAQAEEDGFALAFALAAQGFLDGALDGVVGFRRRHDAFAAREQHAGLEALVLRVGHGFHQAQLLGVRHHGRHAVVAQATGVEARRREGAAQGVHLGQRRHVAGVAVVVGVLAARERGAGRRLHGHDARLGAAAQAVADEGEGNAGKVGAAAGAAHHHVGPGVGHLHLLHGLQADHRLVQQHVVEHRAQRVLGVVALHGQFHGFGDGDAQAAGVVGALREHAAAVLGFGGRRGQAARAIGFHHGAAVGLLVVRHAHLEHQHLQIEQRARERQRGAPLARAGLGGQALDAGLLVVESLRDRGVGLVAAGGAHALVLVEDFGGRAQGFFEPVRAEQRRGAPELVDLAHGLGDLDLALGADFLQDQFHREQGRQVVRAHGLVRAGVQHGRQGLGQVGLEVVPGLGHLALLQQELGLTTHRFSLLGLVGMGARAAHRPVGAPPGHRTSAGMGVCPGNRLRRPARAAPQSPRTNPGSRGWPWRRG